jgi:hypothetical protein
MKIRNFKTQPGKDSRGHKTGYLAERPAPEEKTGYPRDHEIGIDGVHEIQQARAEILNPFVIELPDQRLHA